MVLRVLHSVLYFRICPLKFYILPPSANSAQVVLLPVLLGAALNQAFPKAVALLSPLCALSAAVLIALICGSVMAQNAAAVLTAGPALLAALCALHSGERWRCVRSGSKGAAWMHGRAWQAEQGPQVQWRRWPQECSMCLPCALDSKHSVFVQQHPHHSC